MKWVKTEFSKTETVYGYNENICIENKKPK